jgi:hypothetical protein|tara:strand:- start:121 stop:234 length:114 start_codon:yes stop_codon:yes gene_type:complete
MIDAQNNAHRDRLAPENLLLEWEMVGGDGFEPPTSTV